MLFEEGRLNMCKEYNNKMFFVSVFFICICIICYQYEKNQQTLQGRKSCYKVFVLKLKA